MPENLSRKPKLLIVSDTSMWKTESGTVAFEPVVREIEHFYTLFDQIVWIGYQNNRSIDANTREITAGVPIQFVRLDAVGGYRLSAKLRALLIAPYYAWLIWHYIQKAEVVHTRAPSLPAFWAICFSFLDKKRIYWHKYAGNWQEPKPPIFYGLQRSLLKMATRTKVTINGKWQNQQHHLLSFENPCLDEADIAAGKVALAEKDFNGKLNFCFVGRLEDAKGVGRILSAFQEIHSDRIGTIHLVGDGSKRRAYEEMAAELRYSFVFHGFLDRRAINMIYAQSHIFLLPSDSEGFPKVIAEAMNFGCVPLVSDVSSIPQYIQDGKNGFLWRSQAISFPLYFSNWIHGLDKFDLRTIADQASQIAETFTYQHYIKRLCDEVLN